MINRDAIANDGGRPAPGPRPVLLSDGTTAWSTGLFHTWIIRARDRRNARRTDRAISPTTVLADASVHTIEQHAEAALRG